MKVGWIALIDCDLSPWEGGFTSGWPQKEWLSPKDEDRWRLLWGEFSSLILCFHMEEHTLERWSCPQHSLSQPPQWRKSELADWKIWKKALSMLQTAPLPPLWTSCLHILCSPTHYIVQGQRPLGVASSCPVLSVAGRVSILNPGGSGLAHHLADRSQPLSSLAVIYTGNVSAIPVTPVWFDFLLPTSCV